jgi:ferric-dicitrate binding protein FerR (iron transport regulator)
MDGRQIFLAERRRQETRTRRPVARLAGLAAGIAALAVGASVAWRTGWFARPQPFREFASAAGGRATITLRDGTHLVLGPATRLRVPADFGAATRTVELDGEALFTVVHDPRHPFTIRTARSIVRDIGTTFAVHAYAADRTEQVAVADGEVSVAGVSLQGRDLMSVDTAGVLTVRRGIDVSPYIGFAQGALAFRDTPLRDAAVELARTYDLEVTIADSALGALRVTASFNGQTVDQVLEEVTRVVHAHYERTGRAVMIRSGAAPNDPGFNSHRTETR